MGIANRRSRGCPCASKGVRWWGKTARLSAPFRYFVECRTVSLGQRATPPDGTHDEGEAQATSSEIRSVALYLNRRLWPFTALNPWTGSRSTGCKSCLEQHLNRRQPRSSGRYNN